MASKQNCVETARSVVLVVTARNGPLQFCLFFMSELEKCVLNGHVIRIQCTDCSSGVGTEAMTDTRVEG